MKTVCLALLLLSGLAEARPAERCVNIFYDRAPGTKPAFRFGRVHAMSLQNLLGHFPAYRQRIVPVEEYRSGQIDRCQVSFYLGAYFDNRVPSEFLSDFLAARHTAVWLGYNVWKLPPAELELLWGVKYEGLSKLDPTRPDRRGHPAFYRHIDYLGETFTKYGEWDKKDPKRFNAAYELTVLRPIGPEGERNVVAWARDSVNPADRVPYVLRSGRHWYFADSPFSFMTEDDRYLIFADLLFDIMNEPPRRKSGPQPAVFRLEDVHPLVPLWQLYRVTRTLARLNVPFAMTLVPIFSDPFGAVAPDPPDRFVPLTERPEFMHYLHFARASRATFIYHGVTHQYGNRLNPFTGATGDDFELWDRVKDSPIAEDSARYVVERLEDGQTLFSAAGIQTSLWITPHYQASVLDYLILGQLFEWSMGRIIYFPFQAEGLRELPAALRLGGDTSGHGQRLPYFDQLRVGVPSGLQPAGQFYPYEIYGDAYGQRVIPENVGNVQPYLTEQVLKTISVDDIIRNLRRNRKLRDSWGSLFFHPAMIATHEDEGVGEYPGDVREVERLVKAARELGYEFVDLKQWIKENGGPIRPPPEEVFVKEDRWLKIALRKLVLMAWTLGLLSLSPARADDGKLPSPKEVLARAAKGRAEMIIAIGDVQRFAPAITASATLYPYLETLDPLEVLAKKYGMETMGQSPVRSLAVTLTRAALKWLRFDQASRPVLQAFFRWAEEGTRFNGIEQQTAFLQLPTTVEDLFRWSSVMKDIPGWIPPAEQVPHIRYSLEGLQGLVTRRLLAQYKSLTEKQIQQIIDDTRGASGLSEALAFVQEEVLHARQPELLVKACGWARQLGRQVQAMGEGTPFALRGFPGQILIECLGRKISASTLPEEAEIKTSLELMLPSQRVELASTIPPIFTHRMTAPSMAERLASLIALLIEKEPSLDGPRRRELERFQRRVITAMHAHRNDLEGTYQVTVDGAPATLTIVDNGISQFLAGINIRRGQMAKYGGMYYSMLGVRFDARRGMFEASRYGLDSQPGTAYEPDWWMGFRVEKTEDGVELTGSFRDQYGLHEVHGDKTQSYPSCEASPGPGPSDIAGIYGGRVGGKGVRFSLTPAAEHYSGLISWPREVIFVPLPFAYYHRANDCLVATSGELEASRWVQMRGRFSPDGKTFEGHYIISGQGLVWKVGLVKQGGLP